MSEETKSNNSLTYSEGAKLPSTAPSWAIAASERLKKRREEGYKSSCNPPPNVKKVLLHSCCAPCSGAMVEEMCSSDKLDQVVVFFYNPNIHPRQEYEIRKEENKRFCQKLGEFYQHIVSASTVDVYLTLAKIADNIFCDCQLK